MKEKILNKSLELFSSKGFDAVSVSMISEGLGISKGALYKHYESKKAIFDAIIKRMEENDYAMSADFDLPTDMFCKMPEAYKGSSLEQLFSFTFAMFFYWTENDFASKFRKMISIEQYSSPEMADLFQQYLGAGPLAYVADILRSVLDLKKSGMTAEALALEFYGPVFMLIEIYDNSEDKKRISDMLKEHIESFMNRILDLSEIRYPRSQRYCTPQLLKLIMGPNPIKLEEELLENNNILRGSVVCDLGSGTGLTSVFMAKEYGFKVYAADLWSDPVENARFFTSMGLTRKQIVPVKADAMALPFEENFFDAVVSVDSYNYFGRDPSFLDEKLLPYIKSGGYVYIAIPGMKKDCHDNLPEELLLSWNEEQMDFMHDLDYWRAIIEKSEGFEIITISEMRSNKEVWDDWLRQDNEYAKGDRKSMEAGAGKYLNFIKIVLRKK